MNSARAAARELIGLFVDDGSLAAAVLVWVAVVVLAFPAMPIDSGWLAATLFVGVAAILVENLLRAARRRPGG